MIRVFELFCKLNFINFSVKDLFLQFMTKFNPHDHMCPFCKAKHPDWKKHAVYERYIISFENGRTVSYQVIIVRYRCSCCGHTHAVLPEFIIPYSSYSFLFIIAVMRDYFTGSLTVEGICDKYGISVSTLYSWKELFLKHKKIWLGLLDDGCISSADFLNYIFTQQNLPHNCLLYNLKQFFLMAGVSFLQNNNRRRKAHSAPA